MVKSEDQFLIGKLLQEVTSKARDLEPVTSLKICRYPAEDNIERNPDEYKKPLKRAFKVDQVYLGSLTLAYVYVMKLVICPIPFPLSLNVSCTKFGLPPLIKRESLTLCKGGLQLCHIRSIISLSLSLFLSLFSLTYLLEATLSIYYFHICSSFIAWYWL